jgi:hypothetical protein
MKIVDRKPYVEKEWFGVTLRIAAAHTTEHVRKEREVLEAYRQERGKETFDETDWREIHSRACPGSVLLGWEGFVIDGEEIPYSDEAAEALLRDDDETYRFVLMQSMNTENFLSRSRDAIVKKLQPVSGGSLNTGTG